MIDNQTFIGLIIELAVVAIVCVFCIVNAIRAKK